MAPDFPADVVVFNLYFEGNELKALLEGVERPSGIRDARVHVSWDANTPPDGFFALGEGAIYVRNAPEFVKLGYHVNVEVEGGDYICRYNTRDYLMMVLVFPSGYVPTALRPRPSRAKVMPNTNRLAAYWNFAGDGRRDAEVTWIMKRSESEVRSAAAGINKAAISAQPPAESPVALEPALAGDRLAAWAFGAVSLLFLMALIFFGPSNLSPNYRPIIRFIAAICAGVVSGFFVGQLRLGGKIPGLDTDMRVAAAGGFAAFALVLLLWSH
jgi:hypothetical protein